MQRFALLLLSAAGLAGAAYAAPPPASSAIGEPTAAEAPRLLLIALDAVPHDTMDQVARDGSFSGFAGPVPLISTYPSTTSLALAGILEGFGLARSPGYEHRFFDHQRNRIRGGGLFSYKKHLFPWRKFFDWQSEGLFKKGFLLLRPQKAGRKSFDRSLAAFAASDKPIYTIYHDLTDLIGHVKGPARLEPLLRHLSDGLEALRQRPGAAPFHTVIYSDHGLAGGEPLRNTRKSVKRALKQGGYRLRGRIREPRDVVFIPYGLVSSLVAFTAPGEAVGVARTLAAVEGIDHCVADDTEGWRIEAATGSAQVLRRQVGDEVQFAYRPLTGDPLEYADLEAEATRQDAAPGDGDAWRSDAWWLERTGEAAYPDALYRIARGFDLVENPASLICSNSDGYMYGAAYTVFGSRISTGKLRWTHGALGREASQGFVMSDASGWQAPEAARFDQALSYWTKKD
ncbi:MAG: hypothetical protein AAF657_01720 [Acidobacteriota bacterium]